MARDGAGYCSSILLILRDPITDFLRRASDFDAYGVRLRAVAPAQQTQEAAKVATEQANDPLDLVRTRPEMAVQLIQRYYRGYMWEKAFNVIYGSQIEVLIHLEERGAEGERYVNLIPYFQQYLARGGSARTQMADYLAFLGRMQFMEYISDESGQRARVTPAGVDFLSYLRAEYGEDFWQSKPY